MPEQYESPFKERGHDGPHLAMNAEAARQHPGAPRDVDLADWLNGAAFHPADTPLKQAAHEAVRGLIGEVGTVLWEILPPGRAKSLAFTGLEPVRFYANMALAVGGGPKAEVTLPELYELMNRLTVQMPADPRVDLEAYKAGQLDPEAASRSVEDVAASNLEPIAPFEYRREHGGPEHYTKIGAGLTAVRGPEPAVKITVVEHNESENVTDGGEIWIEDPEILENLASHLLSMANQLRALKAR